MNTKTVLVLMSSLLMVSCVSAPARALDLKEFEKKLTTDGVEVEIHGASPDLGLFVLDYRNPQNFFDYLEMSMVAADDTIQKKFGDLHRHDRVKIKGKFLDNPSPQKHVEVSGLEMVKKYDSNIEVAPYEYEAKLPDDLLHQNEATFLVHALHAEGKILVVEYKDVVLPVYIKDGAELTKGLFRNDIIKLKYVIRTYPESPTHLMLDAKAPNPVQVVESIQSLHGKPADVEGALILFPKSPQVLFNVFAVIQELPNGLRRQFTLVNFDSPDEFKKIRDKLQAAWDRHPGAFVNGRNKLVSTAVRVHAKGKFNEVDPNQANAQILLDTVDSIEVLE